MILGKTITLTGGIDTLSFGPFPAGTMITTVMILAAGGGTYATLRVGRNIIWDTVNLSQVPAEFQVKFGVWALMVSGGDVEFELVGKVNFLCSVFVSYRPEAKAAKTSVPTSSA